MLRIVRQINTSCQLVKCSTIIKLSINHLCEHIVVQFYYNFYKLLIIYIQQIEAFLLLLAGGESRKHSLRICWMKQSGVFVLNHDACAAMLQVCDDRDALSISVMIGEIGASDPQSSSLLAALKMVSNRLNLLIVMLIWYNSQINHKNHKSSQLSNWEVEMRSNLLRNVLVFVLNSFGE